MIVLAVALIAAIVLFGIWALGPMCSVIGHDLGEAREVETGHTELLDIDYTQLGKPRGVYQWRPSGETVLRRHCRRCSAAFPIPDDQ